MNMLDYEMRKEARKSNDAMLSLVHDLGGNVGKYRRERTKAPKTIVSEIYSPPKVTSVAKLCPSFGILPGFALDLSTSDTDGRAWDFNHDDMQARAWAKIKSEQPMLLIGTPMCTALSAWQHLNRSKRDATVCDEEMGHGLKHLKFCCELYAYQVGQGRYFLHEHPAQATSWGTKYIKEIMNMEGVDRTVADQCRYGSVYRGRPVRKPSGFLSNCAGIRKALSTTCSGKHGQCSRPGGGEHLMCNGRVARMAAIFPLRLCKAILRGLRDQLKADGVVQNG